MSDDTGGPSTDDGSTPLSQTEVRVLGCLIEKEATTPDNYPLTLNSLRLACNQSTSRDPVVEYDDVTIEQALASLRARGLTRTVHSTSNRAAKYRHVVPEAMILEPEELAVLDVLMLRGPQTPGELKTRTERQHKFGNTDDVVAVLTGLAERDEPLVVQLERQPGQKDARWVQLLAGPPDPDTVTAASTPRARPANTAPTMDHEFDAAFEAAAWTERVADIIDSFDGVDLMECPFVDLSAGVGTAITPLYRVAPGAQVVAVEPSAAKRTALLSLIGAHPEWDVTVEPCSIIDAQLPPSVAAVVALDVLPGASSDVAEAMWRYLAEHLVSGGVAVVGTAPPRLPTQVTVGGLAVERNDREYIVRRDSERTVLFRAPAPVQPPMVDVAAAIATARSLGLAAEERSASLLVRRVEDPDNAFE